MKTMKPKISSRNWVRIAVVSTMAVAGLLALVAPSDAGGGPHGRPRSEAGPPHGDGFAPGGRMMLGGGPLAMLLGKALDDAKLTDAQQATLDGLRKKAETLRDDARDQFESVHADVETELAKAEPDLRSLSQRMTALHDKLRQSLDDVRDGYLTLYEELSAEQKRTVATALRARVDERKQRREGWQHDRRWRGAGEDDG